jgi:hypothetical protein
MPELKLGPTYEDSAYLLKLGPTYADSAYVRGFGPTHADSRRYSDKLALTE